MQQTAENPYQSPQEKVEPAAGGAQVLATAKAQKLVMYAILLNFSTIVLGFIPIVSLLVLPVALASLVMGIIGIVRLTTSLDMSLAVKIVSIVLLFVPLVNLVVLVVLNGKATKRIRDAGFRVGLIGADIGAIQGAGQGASR